jgi:hypothetical protein
LTLIVGIRCSDGVVLASDSAATYAQGISPTVGQQAVTKVHQLDDSMLFASTGAIGISQILCNALPKLFQGPLRQSSVTSATDAMMEVSKKIREQVASLFESATRVVPLIGQHEAKATVLCRSMVALAFRNECCLYQFDYSGAPEQATKDLPFISLGSGQNIADPFLALLKRILWLDREPTVPEGRFVAAWTISHVALTNPGGVALPLQMASLQYKNGKPAIEFVADPAEHYQMIEAAEISLRDHIRTGQAGPSPDIPKPPAAAVKASAGSPSPPGPPASGGGIERSIIER